jgi:hypothetical protein
MELIHMLREPVAELVDGGNDCLKVIPVFYAGRLCNLRDGLSVQSDQIVPQDGE